MNNYDKLRLQAYMDLIYDLMPTKAYLNYTIEDVKDTIDIISNEITLNTEHVFIRDFYIPYMEKALSKLTYSKSFFNYYHKMAVIEMFEEISMLGLK